jgi:hypothetical protein
LRQHGVTLTEVLSDFEPVDLQEAPEDLPQVGWRIILERPADELMCRRVELAAPHQDEPEGWAMFGLNEQDGRWQCGGVDLGPTRARPGKATRRRGLQEDPIIGIVGEPLFLQVALRNVSEQTWPAGGAAADSYISDELQVIAWLQSADGETLPAQQWFTFASVRSTDRIEPGETVMLPARIATENVETLPPGDYGLLALLMSLDLRAERGRLRLLEPDGIVRATYAQSEQEREEAMFAGELPGKYYGVPSSVQQAEAWVRAMIEWFGAELDPSRSFADYPQSHTDASVGDYVEILDRCLEAARALLGDRLQEVVRAEFARNATDRT